MGKDMTQAATVDRPFPWQCAQCGANKVVMAEVAYDAKVRHDGRLHEFTVEHMRIPVCEACGERVFTEEVDRQISDALRTHLKLLTPGQMADGIKRLGMTQREAAQCVGIAEETLSRWLNETQIQSRSMDNLLRVFFAFPEVRSALCAEGQDPTLGISAFTARS